MSIRKKLQLNIALLIMLTIVLLITQQSTQLLFKDYMMQERQFDRLVQSSYELSLLTHEVVTHHAEERPQGQWRQKYLQMDTMLQNAFDPTLQNSFDYLLLHEQYARIGSLYDDLILSIKEKENVDTTSTAKDERFSRLTDSIIRMSQLMIGDVNKVRETFYAQYKRNSAQLDLTVSLFTVLLALAIIFMSYYLLQTIMTSLDKFSQGIQQVTQGGLDTRITIEQQDELRDFATAFNNMLMTLQSTMATREELEKQVKDRTEALEKSRLAAISITEDVNRQRKELETVKTELEKANVKLQELDKLKSMFIASMSHELRTPLNAIIGFTGLLLQQAQGPLNEKQADHLRRVRNAGQHLLSLISDVIDISKIEAGRIESVTEEFMLSGITREAMEEIEILAKPKHLELRVEMDHDIPMCTDRKRLYQCILNYLSNAVKFTESGSILLKVDDLTDRIKLSVVDTGIGIAEEDISRLFEAFERLETHLRVKPGGSGLGLYLTKCIVTGLLKGEVAVESKVGQGSTFSLTIPKHLDTSAIDEKDHL
ncbi:MAG: ATP-binding protein [Sulfurimonadaceae bacterium]|nr:ATP-binding protein [Sulfurimonadaceae bacterium]